MASSFTISPVDRMFRTYVGAFTDENGDPATISSVDVVALPRRARLTAGLTWTTVALTGSRLRLLYAGPFADPAGAVAIPADGADVYARITDNPEVEAVKIDTVLVS